RLPIGYRMGHIPNALALDPTREFFVYGNGIADLAALEAIANALGARGIANDSPIIIYDEWTGQLAAITFWVLQSSGHRDVKILHGGWAVWKNANAPISRESPTIAPADYRARADTATRATAEWIQENSARPDLVLLDVRTADEYRGGHIPGAVNLPYDAALDLQTQTFKDAATLRDQLITVGATPEKEIVVYCAAGARSAHSYTMLKLLGYPRVRNYDGSMNDWFRVRGLPLE
ncbi:MAG: sulfurtransferase, partial [Chloroflexi bacterium]|nr:sulfurtransferase [Chloroflexota bacterium]